MRIDEIWILSNLAARLGPSLRRMATYDVFPVFSAKVRKLLYNPLGVLLYAAAAALLCGLFLHQQGFVLFGGIAAVMVLGVSWPWISIRGLRGTLSFEQARVSEDEPACVRLTVRNRLPWAAWGLVIRGGFGESAANDEPAASIAAALGWRALRCRWSFVPPCRGAYPRGVSCVATGFPFGLWENRRRLAVEKPLLVWPRTFPVGPVPAVDGDQQVEGCVSAHKIGSMGDVIGVRPYRRGDSPRRIHWGQSARHDRLIVCELQSNARPAVQIVLDAAQDAHVGSSREWAIRIAASLAKGWLQEGVPVGAVWGRQVVAATAGLVQVQQLLDGLALLPDDAGPSLGDLLTQPASREFRQGPQIVITTDRALARWRPSRGDPDQRRWVVLETAAFGGGAPLDRLPVRPWLRIDNPERIPALLRHGWKEARHGS
jgi:uncharacterized protein (DUF58 family)